MRVPVTVIASSATPGATPTDPTFEFDHERGELKISIPYVPEILFVTLWGTVNGTPTQPPAPWMPPVSGEGVPVKPPKEIKVVIQES